MENIRTLEKYRNSNNENEVVFYKERIKLGICFVVVEINGKLFFAPSRFVGYKNNNMGKHNINETKDGRKTNPEIDKILGEHKKDDKIQEAFKNFCESNDIDYGETGWGGHKRQYWPIQRLPNIKWF